MHALDKYFWLLALLISAGNSLLFRSDQKQLTKDNPALVHGLSRRVLGHFIFWSAPWWLMGVIVMTGGAEGVSAFRPCLGNGLVAIFFTFLAMMILGVGIWIWLFGGDEYLVWAKMFKGSAKTLKTQYAFACVGVVFIFLTSCYLS